MSLSLAIVQSTLLLETQNLLYIYDYIVGKEKKRKKLEEKKEKEWGAEIEGESRGEGGMIKVESWGKVIFRPEETNTRKADRKEAIRDERTDTFHKSQEERKV